MIAAAKYSAISLLFPKLGVLCPLGLSTPTLTSMPSRYGFKWVFPAPVPVLSRECEDDAEGEDWEDVADARAMGDDGSNSKYSSSSSSDVSESSNTAEFGYADPIDDKAERGGARRVVR